MLQSPFHLTCFARKKGDNATKSVFIMFMAAEPPSMPIQTKAAPVQAGSLFAHLQMELGRPIRVMQLVPALDGGGVEQGVVDVNAALAAAGAQSYVVSTGGRRQYDITRAGGQVLSLDVKSKNPLNYFARVRALRKLIKKYDIDIVHPGSRIPAWIALGAIKGTKAQLVTSVHSTYGLGSSLKKKYNAVMTKGAHIIAVSEYLKRHLMDVYGVAPDKIDVIHRGVDLTRYAPESIKLERIIQMTREWRVPDGVNVVLLPGRLTPAKGHMVLVDALAQLGRKDVFAVFVGAAQTEGYRRVLEDHIAACGLGGQVRLVDHCNDMTVAYMAANIVVIPSVKPEGFGRTAIEAQAMARPVIASDLGGLAETIDDGQSGFLCRIHAHGSGLDLAHALQRVLDMSPDQRAALGMAARAHVIKHFDLNKMTGATLDVYARVLSSGTAEHDPDAAA